MKNSYSFHLHNHAWYIIVECPLPPGTLPKILLPDIAVYDTELYWWSSLYRKKDLFSRLLSAYMCIDLLPILGEHWTTEKILVSGGYKDILEMLG